MRVIDLTITENDTIRQALQRLDTAAKKVLFVTRDKKLIGAISDGDIRRWILKNGSLDVRVGEIMNPSPICLKKGKRKDALMLMRKEGITAVPLVNDNGQIEKIYTLDGEINGLVHDLAIPVVIMAGGKGERLMPFTSVLPKPLIPIGDKPIIERVIDSFREYGSREFILSINFRKAMLKAYFEEIQHDYNILYLEETKPLGTGGGLWFLKDKMEGAFFVSNCDILLDVDYSEVYQFHKKNGNVVTMLTCLKQSILPYGVVELDSRDGSVSLICEKPKADYLVNTGVYVMEPDVLDFLGKEEYLQITDLIQKCISAGKRVGAYPISEDAWMDMGQIETLEDMKSRLGVME